MSTEDVYYLLAGEQILSIPKVSGIIGTPLTTTPRFPQKSSREAFHITSKSRPLTCSREQGLTKGKPSSGIKAAIAGYISTIAQSISTTLLPRLSPPPDLQLKKKTLLKSKHFFNGPKPQLPQQSRNFRLHLVDPGLRHDAQEPRPHKQVRFLEQPSPPRPRNQQVRFLLHPYPKERLRPYPVSPPAHFKHPDQLLPHYQLRHRHQGLIHQIHQQPRPWPSRINHHDPWVIPRNHMMEPPARLPPSGTHWPAITT